MKFVRSILFFIVLIRSLLFKLSERALYLIFSRTHNYLAKLLKNRWIYENGKRNW